MQKLKHSRRLIERPLVDNENVRLISSILAHINPLYLLQKRHKIILEIYIYYQVEFNA